MDFRKFWKETFTGFVLKNVFLAIGIVVLLAIIALFSIDYYTKHGQSELVPDLRGLYVEEADILLAKQGLYAQVIDSVYVKDKKLGTIIDQIPLPNSSVKQNRAIYIIINSRQVRQVSVPEISDVSYRQADALLQAVGLSVASVEYTPSEFKDLVIEIKYKGRSIMPGTRVPEGSKLVLVVGSGSGSVEATVPVLKGMGLDDANQAAQTASFSIGAVEYDVTPAGNESDYIIYRQRPAAGTKISAGTKINVYLSKDKNRMNEIFEEDTKPEESEEEFF